MLANRKAARDLLAAASRSRFLDLIREAKLSPRQEQILELHLMKYKSYVQISLAMFVDVNTVKNDVAKAYDQIYRLYLL